MLLRHTTTYQSAMQAMALFGLLDSTDKNFEEVKSVIGGMSDRLHGLADELFVEPYDVDEDYSEELDNEDDGDIDLIEGRKYLITYKIDGLHRIPRHAVLKFMSIDERTDDYLWDYRPWGGTQRLVRSSTISIENVDQKTKLYTNRKVR